eukprot:6200358-Pleurochrysis_carterae.AAC.2
MAKVETPLQMLSGILETRADRGSTESRRVAGTLNGLGVALKGGAHLLVEKLFTIGRDGAEEAALRRRGARPRGALWLGAHTCGRDGACARAGLGSQAHFSCSQAGSRRLHSSFQSLIRERAGARETLGTNTTLAAEPPHLV